MSKKKDAVVEEVVVPEVEVQPEVAPVVISKAEKTFGQLVDETIRGVHGTGRDRMNNLGSNYAKVQQEITRRIRNQ